MKRLGLLIFIVLASCSGTDEDVPPLLKGATDSGGIGYNCDSKIVPAFDPNLAHSPEIIERLARDFPARSQSARLRASLVQQGFRLQGTCSPDKSVSWAQYRRNNNEIVANVYWRENAGGQLVWTFGDIAFTFL